MPEAPWYPGNPCWIHQFMYIHWSLGTLGFESTWMGHYFGTFNAGNGSDFGAV